MSIKPRLFSSRELLYKNDQYFFDTKYFFIFISNCDDGNFIPTLNPSFEQSIIRKETRFNPKMHDEGRCTALPPLLWFLTQNIFMQPITKISRHFETFGCKKKKKISFTPFQKYGSENRPCMRGLRIF